MKPPEQPSLHEKQAESAASAFIKEGDIFFAAGDFERAALKFRQAALLSLGEANSYRRAWEDGGKSERAYAEELIKAIRHWFKETNDSGLPPPEFVEAISWRDVRLGLRSAMQNPQVAALVRYFEETTISLGWDWPIDMAASPLEETLARYFSVDGRRWANLDRIDLRMAVDLIASEILAGAKR